jgi:uracil phosphoribosyltransferase
MTVLTKKMSKANILSDSLSQHYLSIIRDKKSSITEFRQALNRLGSILAFTSLQNIQTQSVRIETPLESIDAQRIKSNFVIVPILRAGLSLLDAMLYFLPDAQIGFIGQKRDEATAQAFEYYKNFPDLKNKQVLIVDPMLATGGSAIATIKELIAKGAKLNDIRFICVIAAPEGIEAVLKEFPEMQIYCAAQDRCLNEQKYIVPGLGDAGDLWAGTGE